MRLMHLALGGCLKAPPVRFGLTEDTGGHITYILGLVQELARRDSVSHVDVVTRRFDDPELGPEYDAPVDELGPKARIVRLSTERRDYLSKEALARELPSFTQALLDHIAAMPQRPDLLHAHFADAGSAALAVRARFGISVVFTAHSLGCDKQAAMAADGACDSPILAGRIAQENAVIGQADAIIASSRDEAERQLMRYPGARAETIHRMTPGTSLPVAAADETEARALIAPFLRDPSKPIVLAIARPVAKKNLDGLIDIFAAPKRLRDIANLVVLAGLRDGIDSGPDDQNDVFARMLARIDAHDLYGTVAYPKRHDQAHVQALYRLAARTGGVFVNPAFCEPFGLTLLEAAEHGLPVVATSFGGPRDIIAELGHGFIADPRDVKAFGTAIESVLTDPTTWANASQNGLTRIAQMGWPAYVSRYLELCENLIAPQARPSPALDASEEKPRAILFSDIDNTLTGSRDAAERFAAWRARERRVGFAVATGRSLQEAQNVLARWRLPEPDIFITSVGSEIYRRGAERRLDQDQGYAAHIAVGWDAGAIEGALAGMAGLRLQDPVEQRAFKRSYFAAHPSVADAVAVRLAEAGIDAHVIFSHGMLLDVLPARAGKGAALRWCAAELDMSEDSCVAAGDSGNDLDMLAVSGRSIVVANRTTELEAITSQRHVYVAAASHADGVLEGLAHFGRLSPAVHWRAERAPSPVRTLRSPA